jgi:hypothetical protein
MSPNEPLVGLYSQEDIIVADHFADIGKTISMPEGADTEDSDIMITNVCFSKFPGVMS